MRHDHDIRLWGARSGVQPSSDRRSSFSRVERDLDQQFMEEARRRGRPDTKVHSDSAFAATDAFPTPAPQPGDTPGYTPETTREDE